MSPRPDLHAASIFFDEVELAPEEEREVVGRITAGIVLFRGTEFVVQESIAGATGIKDIIFPTRTGDSRQLSPGVPSVPSLLFRSNPLSSGLSFQPYEVALGTARITVRNESKVLPVKWSAEIKGQGLVTVVPVAP